MKEEDKSKIVSSILSRVMAAVRLHVIAVAGMYSHEAGDVEGTGTIIELGGHVLLVTAEHVLSQIAAKGYVGISFSNGDGKRYAQVLHPFSTNAQLDVACVKIPRPRQPDSDRLACPETLIESSVNLSEKDLLFIYGFPGNSSRFSAFLKGIRSKSLTYAAYAGMSEDPWFDPSMHLAIKYDPKHFIGGDGLPADFPLPDGLSEATVWKIPRLEEQGTWASQDARIVGVIQRWDSTGRFVIATRIEHVLPFLQNVCSTT
jgi:hypothetical protein